MTILNTKKNFEKFKVIILKDLMEIKSKLSFGRGIETAMDHLAAKYDKDHPEGNFNYDLNINGENWEGGEKSSSRNTVNIITFYGIKFYLKVSEWQSGDYHSDYHYSFDDAEIVSEKEYKKPKVVYSNNIDENIVEFLDNGRVVIITPNNERQVYVDFKRAMKSINVI